MTKYRLIVAMLCTACASAPDTPAEYHQGAYRPVRPPTFSPTQDAPHTIGQPGHLRPGIQVEPGPKHGRVLPQTPETRRADGIWASRIPVADWDRVMFGVELPRPDDLAEYDARLISHCIGSMQTAAQHPDKRGISWPVNKEDVRCLVASLYRFCAENMVSHPDPAKAARHEAVKRVARAFHKSACTEEQRKDDRLNETAAAVGATWRRADFHSSVPME